MNTIIEQGLGLKKKAATDFGNLRPNKIELHAPLKSANIFENTPVKNTFSNQLLTAQSDETFLRLLPFLEREYFDGDQSLYQPGDRIKYLYFPETAVISDFQILEDGRTIETAVTGNEGVTGFNAVQKNPQTVSWTQVIVAGSALKINAESFKREFERDRRLQVILFDFINLYINQVTYRLVCSRYHTVEERFCGWLKMLYKRRAEDSLPLTQEQIARSLGVQRPTISCIAKSLKDRRIIAYRRGKLLILDEDALEKSACNCHRQIDEQFLNRNIYS